ncbi:MAG: c(7)-type cytochrome triheme domain-containing protein [Thermodesulfovibrionales bacterium]
MPYKTGLVVLILLTLLVLPQLMEAYFDLPPLPPPEEYGNILINRTSEKNNVKAVSFSHWIHRRKHTCRVCHFELEFNMKANTTEITEALNRSGRFCGTCHNGKDLFGHENPADCERCHNGKRDSGKEKFAELSKFPKTKFGNGIDCVAAMRDGFIKPVNYLTIKPPEEITFNKRIFLEAEWTNIPAAVFPHKPHNEWLECNMCHPDIFNIKKKTTKHFYMTRILQGEFCGVCHLTVAFPMNDCKRCHPGMGH